MTDAHAHQVRGRDEQEHHGRHCEIKVEAGRRRGSRDAVDVGMLHRGAVGHLPRFFRQLLEDAHLNTVPSTEKPHVACWPLIASAGTFCGMKSSGAPGTL